MVGKKVVALVGNVTVEDLETHIGLEVDSDWSVRLEDPSTPGSTIKGQRERKRARMVVACGSFADLRRATVLLGYEGRTQMLDVLVISPTRMDLFTAPATLEGAESVTTHGTANYVHVKAVSAQASIDIGMACNALLRKGPSRTLGKRISVEDSDLLAWTEPAIGVSANVAGISRDEDVIPPTDVFFIHERQDKLSPITLIEDSLKSMGVDVRSLGAKSLHPVSIYSCSPIGTVYSPRKEGLILRVKTFRSSCWVEAVDAEINIRSSLSEGLDENFIANLREYRYISIGNIEEIDPRTVGQMLVNFGAAGVPLTGASAAKVVGVHPAVRGQYARLDGVDLSDDLARHVWAVDTYRLTLMHHETSVLLGETLSGLNFQTSGPSVSITAAVSRPDSIPSLMRTIASQSYQNVEYLIGFHGISLSSVKDDLLPGVKVLEFDSSRVLGEVLDCLQLASDGDYIAKMDDDDHYSPHHLQDLVQAAIYSRAELIGNKAEFIYLENSDVTLQRRSNSEVYGSYVTGGTMLIQRQMLRDVGGWASVPTAEDRLLQQAVKSHGGQVYRSHGLNYIMSRGDGLRKHTWTPGEKFFRDQSVQSFEGLGYPGWTGTAPK